MKKNKIMWNRAIFIVLYGVAILAYFIVGLFQWQCTKSLQAKPLTLEDFTLVSSLLVENEPNAFVSTDPDPQLVYTQEQPFRVGRFTFSATSNKPGGEMVLYYTQEQDYLTSGFSEKNKIWAKQLPNGTWYFDLEGKEVTAIRLDPDTVGGVVWQVNKIELNAAKSFGAYFAPTGISILAVLLGPLLVGAIVLYIKQMVQTFLQGKKVEMVQSS